LTLAKAQHVAHDGAPTSQVIPFGLIVFQFRIERQHSQTADRAPAPSFEKFAIWAVAHLFQYPSRNNGSKFPRAPRRRCSPRPQSAISSRMAAAADRKLVAPASNNGSFGASEHIARLPAFKRTVLRWESEHCQQPQFSFLLAL